jgi:heme-degrading monooxygenase HmoA
MYARVVNVQFKQGNLDEAKRIVNESIVPVLKEQKGFKSQFLLTQHDTGKAISINLWETEADLSVFEVSPLYREVLGKLAAVLAAPPVGEAYEVNVQA